MILRREGEEVGDIYRRHATLIWECQYCRERYRVLFSSMMLLQISKTAAKGLECVVTR